jgi:hypothetical protein
MLKLMLVTLTTGLASTCAAQSVPIPGLFNTGVDDFGITLVDGASDSHWSILSPVQQGIVLDQALIPGSWLPNTADSRWIWETSSGQPTNVTRTFRISFDLTGLDESTALITGRWSVDNRGLDILINGISTGLTQPGFSLWTNFSVGNGFVPGMNTLDFVCLDFGGISGFRAELEGTARVPAPAAGLAMVGLLAIRRRR